MGIEPRVSKHQKPSLHPLHLSGNLSIDLSMLSFIFSYHQIFSAIEVGLELLTMSFSGYLANLQISLDFGQKNITTIEFSTKIYGQVMTESDIVLLLKEVKRP